MHALDAERHVKLHCLVRPGSADLVDLFLRQASSGVWLANDSSCGAGYAPLSELERVVLGVAARLEQLARGAASAEVGEDTKVLGVRRRERIQLTVACAFVDRFVRDLPHYVEQAASLADDLRRTAATLADHPVEVSLNAADDVASSHVFLTVTGTSAESGDDGQVGRGNRVNGLITPYRPMTLEAAAGKNPVAHVGKLYNIAAHRIAASVVERVAPVTYCECYLASRIGRPITEPHVADLRIQLEPGVSVDDVAPRVRAVVGAGIADVGSLWRDLVAGTLRVF
jgi:S-adenosylmethionine synthetase